MSQVMSIAVQKHFCVQSEADSYNARPGARSEPERRRADRRATVAIGAWRPRTRGYGMIFMSSSLASGVRSSLRGVLASAPSYASSTQVKGAVVHRRRAPQW